MAIISSFNFSGLSTDTKLAAAEGSVFFETDTGNLYRMSAGVWAAWTYPLGSGGTGAATASAVRTALGLGTLATQTGTFSGTSSGTNTGDQTNVSGNAATVTGLTITNSKNLRLDGSFGVAYAKYSFGVDGGLVSTITPGSTVNTTIPANAILVGGTVNVTTAVTSVGLATVAIGCAGTGGTTTTLLAATAKASLTANAVLTSVTTFALPKKLTGAGGITFTIGTAALTAGVIEVWVYYLLAAA